MRIVQNDGLLYENSQPEKLRKKDVKPYVFISKLQRLIPPVSPFHGGPSVLTR